MCLDYVKNKYLKLRIYLQYLYVAIMRRRVARGLILDRSLVAVMSLVSPRP